MGRKTFESIGRPLPNRHNIVITSNAQWHHDGVDTAAGIESALALARSERIFIIGGSQIYAQSLALATELIITEIDRQFECDAFFPKVDMEKWTIAARETHRSESNQFDYAFVTYQRINPPSLQ